MVVITKKYCLPIFAASMRVISAMTGNPPLHKVKSALFIQNKMAGKIMVSKQAQQHKIICICLPLEPWLIGITFWAG